MDTFTVTATQLKNTPADILNRVYYEKKIALVERHGKVIARVTPEINDKPKESFNEIWDRYAGTIPGIPNVRKFRTANTHRFKAAL